MIYTISDLAMIHTEILSENLSWDKHYKLIFCIHAYKILGCIHHTIASTHSTPTMVALTMVRSQLLYPSVASVLDEGHLIID